RADARSETSYATLFAFSILLRILLSPVIANLWAERPGGCSGWQAHILPTHRLGPGHGAGDLHAGAAVGGVQHRVHHLERVLAELAGGAQRRAPPGHVLQADAAGGALVAGRDRQHLPPLAVQAVE